MVNRQPKRACSQPRGFEVLKLQSFVVYQLLHAKDKVKLNNNVCIMLTLYVDSW